MEKKNSNQQGFGDKMRARMTIQNEGRFHFVLQLVFAFAQIAVAYVAFLSDNLASSGVLLFGVFGALMMLLAGKGWQNRAARIAGRVVAAITVLGFLGILTVYTFITRVSEPIGTAFVTRTAGDYIGQLLASLSAMLQPVLLVLFPTFVIAARRTQQTTDIRILQIGGWSLPLMAAVTLALSYEDSTRLFFHADFLGMGNRVLLYFYLLCTLASVATVFLSYPYGTRWIKAKIEKGRNRTASAAADESAD